MFRSRFEGSVLAGDPAMVNARQRFGISLQQHFGVAGSRHEPWQGEPRSGYRGEIDRTAVTSFR
jgi:hypothetical protein